MKDPGSTKQILGKKVHRDEKNGKTKYIEMRKMVRCGYHNKILVKILMSFNMNIVKPTNIPFTFPL
jgi:hypothetical protein